MKKNNIEIRIETVYNGYLVTCHSYNIPEDECRTSNQADSPMTPYGRYNNRYVAMSAQEAMHILDSLLIGNVHVIPVAGRE
jgi:hypothetical protein